MSVVDWTILIEERPSKFFFQIRPNDDVKFIQIYFAVLKSTFVVVTAEEKSTDKYRWMVEVGCFFLITITT